MTNLKVILGIDPGASGAIAALDAAGGDLLWVEDMPTVTVKVGTKMRARIAPAVLRGIMLRDAVDITFIERVGGMTGQSASASFTFGYGAGVVEGAAAALEIAHAFVTPQAWKKAASIRADKGDARQRAQQLWPAHAALFARMKDDGRAEAALIARHGWQTVRFAPRNN